MSPKELAKVSIMALKRSVYGFSFKKVQRLLHKPFKGRQALRCSHFLKIATKPPDKMEQNVSGISKRVSRARL
jgi:hypothetical protein